MTMFKNKITIKFPAKDKIIIASRRIYPSLISSDIKPLSELNLEELAKLKFERINTGDSSNGKTLA